MNKAQLEERHLGLLVQLETALAQVKQKSETIKDLNGDIHSLRSRGKKIFRALDAINGITAVSCAQDEHVVAVPVYGYSTKTEDALKPIDNPSSLYLALTHIKRILDA